MSTTPPPPWQLIDLKRYATMSIQFSRGCPFNCEFCNIKFSERENQERRYPNPATASIIKNRRKNY